MRSLLSISSQGRPRNHKLLRSVNRGDSLADPNRYLARLAILPPDSIVMWLGSHRTDIERSQRPFGSSGDNSRWLIPPGVYPHLGGVSRSITPSRHSSAICASLHPSSS